MNKREFFKEFEIGWNNLDNFKARSVSWELHQLNIFIGSYQEFIDSNLTIITLKIRTPREWSNLLDE